MGKARGLPENYKLKVSTEGLKGPVQLGDYLDDELLPATPKAAPRPSRPRSPSILDSPKENPRLLALAPKQEELPSDADLPGTARAPRKKPPRKQMNMQPETLTMVDELLLHIQTFSGQKDAKASEMFHALVSTLFEAKDCLDFSTVRPRGKWGSPTARAFPVSLKNSFRAAITEWTRKNSLRG